MKKKFREIVVDGENYTWRVDSSWDVTTVKIWKDKKVIINHEVYGFDQVTPKHIAEMIKNKNKKVL